MSRNNKPQSIEASLVSLGALAGGLGIVLLLAIVGVQQALTGSLKSIQEAALPAQTSLSEMQRAVAHLFQRQSQVLTTRNQTELAAYRDRSEIDRHLTDSRDSLTAAMSKVRVGAAAEGETKALEERTSGLLSQDQALFDSVKHRHELQEAFDKQSAGTTTALQKLIQETRAVAGHAHLDYVLLLRKAAKSPAPSLVHRMIHGDERVQQESGEAAVATTLQLGQLVGKIALAPGDDELNSISANELNQNLDRSRAHLRALLGALGTAHPLFARAEQMSKQFDQVAKDISDATNANSLISLRRAVFNEARKGKSLRDELAESVKAFAASLDGIESQVATETARSTRAATRTLWIVRIGILAVFAGAIWIGIGAVRRMRESVSALRKQNEQLASLSGELKTLNEGLEGLVAERSAQLVKRERSMRLVLDSMDEALIPVDLTGRIGGETSKSAVTWFGPAEAGAFAWDYVFQANDNGGTRFQMGFEQIAEDMLPFEASVACMPQRLLREGRTYALSYRQVMEEGQFRSVLVVAKDITSQEVAEAREREAREQQVLLASLLKDKSGFRSFVREGEGLLSDLRTQPEMESTKRALHTLKGSTAVYGMESVARICHDLEERIAETSEPLTEQEMSSLTAVWRDRIHKIEELVTTDAAVELAEFDYAEIVNGLRHRRDYDQLANLVESWKWGATSSLLQRMSRQVRRVAERLEKPVEVSVEHNRLRIMPGPLDSFWGALVHVVRNAVDHGIESPEERVAAGKAERGKVALRTRQLNGRLVVELEDDGRGVDFDALAKVAERGGLPSNTRESLIQAMFRDGVTTREAATELSGRGVGLAAVAAAVRAAGGEIQVDSELGNGTTFRFSFPSDRVNVRQSTHSASGSVFPAASRRVG